MAKDRAALAQEAVPVQEHPGQELLAGPGGLLQPEEDRGTAGSPGPGAGMGFVRRRQGHQARVLVPVAQEHRRNLFEEHPVDEPGGTVQAQAMDADADHGGF